MVHSAPKFLRIFSKKIKDALQRILYDIKIHFEIDDYLISGMVMSARILKLDGT